MGLVLVPTAVKTANYQAVAGDFVMCDVTGGTFDVTLPESGQVTGDLCGVQILATNSSLNALRVIGHSAYNNITAPDTIAVSGSFFPIANYLSNLYDSVVYQWNGSAWVCMSDNRRYADAKHSTITANYTATAGENILTNASGNITITLPTNPSRLGDKITVTNATSHLVTISGTVFSKDGSGSSLVLYLPGESVTLEYNIAWNVVADGRIPHGAGLINTTGSNITNGTVGLDVPFANTTFDHGGLADTANNRITIVRPGLYNVCGSLSYETVTANSSKVCQAIIKVNGVNTVFAQLATSLTTMRLTLSCQLNLAAGDHLTLGAYQNTGSTLTTSNTDPAKLSAVEVR